MIEYYKNVNGVLKEVKKLDKGRVWIDVSSPNDEELEKLSKMVKIPLVDLKMALDEDERPRVDVSKNYTMIIFRSPFVKKDDEIETSPIGIFLTKKYVITIHLFYTGYVKPIFEPSKNMKIESNSEFLLHLLSQIVKGYFQVLRKIEKHVDIIEDEVIKDPKNVTIEKTADIKRALIYFHRSLVANRVVLLTLIEKNIPFIDKKFSENFKDIHTEIFQLLEMTVTYRDLIKGSMDTYSSISSNKLGETMRILTVLTALLTIPTFFVNLYSMNVDLPLQHNPFIFTYLIVGTFLIMLATYFALRMKKWI